MYCRYPSATDLAKYKKKGKKGKKKVPSGCKLVKMVTYACPTKRRSKKRSRKGSKGDHNKGTILTNATYGIPVVNGVVQAIEGVAP